MKRTSKRPAKDLIPESLPTPAPLPAEEPETLGDRSYRSLPLDDAASDDFLPEGEEGAFYVWKPAELGELLGDEDARLFGAFYDVKAPGNFEGRASILHVDYTPADLAPRLGVPEAELNSALEVRAVHPVIDQAFEFSEACTAYRFLESQRHFGKIVICV